MIAYPLFPVRDYFHPLEVAPSREQGEAISLSDPSLSLLSLVFQAAIQSALFCLIMLVPALAFGFARSRIHLVLGTPEGAMAYGVIGFLAISNVILYGVSLTKALVRTLKRF